MLNLKIFSATEARAKLFQIFRIVSEGEEVVIVNKDTGKKFKIVPFEQEPKKDKTTLLKKAAKIGLKTMSPADLKKIFQARLDPCN